MAHLILESDLVPLDEPHALNHVKIEPFPEYSNFFIEGIPKFGQDLGVFVARALQ